MQWQLQERHNVGSGVCIAVHIKKPQGLFIAGLEPQESCLVLSMCGAIFCSSISDNCFCMQANKVDVYERKLS